MKIAFYGSSTFSLAILERLFYFNKLGKVNLIYVVSQPSKQRKFGEELVDNPVVKYCKKNSIKFLTPNKITDEFFWNFVNENPIDLAIVAAYGKILPESLINKAKYGFLNFHGSLLPKYRGAAPVQFTILNQDMNSAGISIIKMDKGMDTGKIIKKQKLCIKYEEFQSLTAGQLMDKLADLSVDVLDKEFEYLFNPNNWLLESQDDNQATYCYEVDMAKKNFEVNFHDGVRLAHGKIMAANPAPIAFINLDVDNKPLAFNILRSHISDISVNLDKKGKLSFHKHNKRLFLELCDGFLEIIEIQPQGKKIMDSKNFINGYSKYIS